MHVWLNGTFGVGKTTTAALMREMDVRFRPFDAEWVGYMLRANLGDLAFEDFQELRPWRTLVPRVAREIVDLTGDRLVVVQSVLHEPYWIELQEGLSSEGLEFRHVVLDADEGALRERIDGDREFHDLIAAGRIDPGAVHFRRRHVEAYMDAREWMVRAADLVVDTVSSSASEVAAQVLAGLD